MALSLLSVLPAVLGSLQQAQRPGETCRASLFPEGNPLLQPALDESSAKGLREEEVTPVTHPAFKVKTSQFVSEYGFHAVEYVHSTGATVWSLSTPSSEQEMTFNICFRTLTTNSYGTPHVFEHAVFQGSRKYPLPSLFAKIRRRSLSTYVNAVTAGDRTCYPLASLNSVDLYNMAGLYLEFVFHPLAVENPLILAQEGWRYELSPADKEAKDVDCSLTPDACVLKYSGVVMSEMKGVWDNPDGAEVRLRFSNLFPDVLTYSTFSGGLPAEIPRLTLEHLQKYHEAYYTPQNAWITFYGPDDVAVRLKFIDEFFKGSEKRFASQKRDIQVTPQITFDEPKYAEYPVASASPTLKDIVTINWVLNPCTAALECEEIDGEVRVALQVLNHLLMGTKASPLYKALAGSRLGTSVMDADLDFSVKHAMFTVGLKGVEHRDGAAADVETLVLQTLASLADTGFSAEKIAASLNAIEFHLREFPRGQVLPRGLMLTRMMSGQITYGRDPILAVRFADAFRALRQRLSEDPNVFGKLIQKYFLQNPHRLTLRMKASKTLAAEVAEKERQHLEDIKKNMTREELKQVLKVQEDLRRFQETPDDALILQSLPRMERENIQPTGDEIPIAPRAEGSVPLLTHELFTSGLVYIDVGLSLADLSLEDISYLPLLAGMLCEAGTTQLPPEVLLPLIGRLTGGIKASYEFHAAPAVPFTVPDPYAVKGFLFLSGKAFGTNSLDLWCLLHTILVDVNLDNSQIGEQIIKERITALEDQMRSLPFRSAKRTAVSSFGAAAFATETVDGYPNLVFYRELLKQAESDWSVISGRLTLILQRLLQRRNLALNVTGDAGSLFAATEGPARKALVELVHAIPEQTEFRAQVSGKRVGPEAFDAEPLFAREIRDRGLLVPGKKTAFVVPVQVSDTSLATRLPLNGAPILGSDFVGVSYLENVFLFATVRERRGAYGAWTRIGLDGSVMFASYRDPNAMETLETFRSTPSVAARWAEAATEDEVLEAILPAISLLDWPFSVERKGRRSFWEWASKEAEHHRNKFRQEIINTNKKDLKVFAEKLADAFNANVESVAIIGPQAVAEEAAATMENLQRVSME